MSRSTPGPWHVEEENGAYGVFAKEALLAVSLTDDIQDEETAKANARLMAAAPLLLEVIKEIKEHLDNNVIVTADGLKINDSQLREAIQRCSSTRAIRPRARTQTARRRCATMPVPEGRIRRLQRRQKESSHVMANRMRQRAIDGLRQGDSFSYKRSFTYADTASFGDLTRDYNPVHYDERWARLKGCRTVICHGLLVGSMICEFGGQVGWLASGMNFKFIKPVYPGDTVDCTITITQVEENGRAEAEALFTNQNNERVCYAHLKGILPLNPERDLLGRMAAEGDTTNKLR